MTDIDEPENPVDVYDAGIGLYVGAIVVILFIAGVGTVFSRDPALLLTLCGTVIVSFLALLQVHIKTREAVSRIDKFIKLTQKVSFSEGEKFERTKHKEED